jgi:Cell cycle protein
VKTRPAGQLEQRLLVLVTLGLVAFGLVMVFSATSASAALGAGDPMTFLVKQGAYAFAGLLLLALASRFDYHRRSTARSGGSSSDRSASSPRSWPRSQCACGRAPCSPGDRRRARWAS